MFSEGPLPGSQMAIFSLCPHMGEGARVSGLTRISSIRKLIKFMMVPPSWANHLPKAQPPNTISLEIKFRHMNLRGYKHSVHSNTVYEFLWPCLVIGEQIQNRQEIGFNQGQDFARQYDKYKEVPETWECMQKTVFNDEPWNLNWVRGIVRSWRG